MTSEDRAYAEAYAQFIRENADIHPAVKRRVAISVQNEADLPVIQVDFLSPPPQSAFVYRQVLQIFGEFNPYDDRLDAESAASLTEWYSWLGRGVNNADQRWRSQ